MPARSDDLIPVTYSDFSAGLWERGNDRECPPNGLLEAQDCMPLPTGGLRAAWAWREESRTNLPANRRVIGFQITREPGAHGALDAGLMLGSTSTAASGPFLYEYWMSVGTTGLSDFTGWTSGPTHSSFTRLYPSKFVASYSSNLTRWYYNVAAESNPTTRGGVFRLNSLASSVSVQVFSSDAIFVTRHQDRLVYVTDAAPALSGIARWDRLQFTEPSTDAAPPSSNFLDLRNRVGIVSYLEPSFPSDLFALKESGGNVVIQGDIGGGPLVREAYNGQSIERLSWGVIVSGGVAYMTEKEGVWLWEGGSNLRLISPQIVGTPMTEPTLFTGSGVQLRGPGFLGGLGSGGSWLFTPKGYIYDMTQGLWFRSTLPFSPNIYPYWSIDSIGKRIYAAGYSEPGSDLRLISCSLDISRMSRSGSFSATLPIIDTTERNVELRRIEIFGQGFGNGGTWQLELSNDQGQTETTEPLQVQARAASARANTKLQGDWIKVRLLSEGNADASSSTGKSEAPMLERIVLYLRSRQTRAA